MGLKGVSLNSGSSAADGMNQNTWLNAKHTNGSGTWEAQAFDTLRVIEAF
jgi:hypothetical protein